MDLYTRMFIEDANEYNMMKKAFLTRYNFSKDGYRQRFRDVKPEAEDTSLSFD